MNTIDYYMMLAGFPDEADQIPVDKIDYLINLHDNELYTPIVITDHSTMNIIACSENMYNLTGYTCDEFKSKGMNFVISIIHPDDFDRIQNLHRDLFDVYFSIAPDYRSKLKYCYNVRFKKKTGEYIWIMQDAFFLLLDKNGNPKLSALELRDISYLKNDESLILNIYDPINTNGFKFTKKYVKNNNNISFTKREIQILGLIGKGKLTKQIADIIHISEFTVSKHRQNMLKKTKCTTITELVTTAQNLGWL